MAQAPNYVPTTGFATDETNQAAGRSTVKTVSIDTEFANISTSVNTINTNLQKLQRDDGKFKDGLIEPYALAEQTRALIASGGKPKGSWLSDQNYEVGDAVTYISTSYLCVVAHTSTVSFASGLWMAISGDGSSFLSAGEAALSASNAASSASLATSNASAALVSANSATASATTANNSAITAQNSATSAAASAVTAQTIISNNIAGSSQEDAEAGTDNAKYMSPLRTFQAITAKAQDLPTLNVKGNTTLGDAGTDTATLNAQLSAGGGVGTSGQFLKSRGTNSSPIWDTVTIPSGSLLNIQYFTSLTPVAYAPTAGTTFIVAEVVGGGGGGEAGSTVVNTATAGIGGQGGSYAYKRITSGFSGATVTVGGGGTGGTGNGGNGGGGGTSSLGSLVTAGGGAGGGNAASVAGTSGDINVAGASATSPRGGISKFGGSGANTGQGGDSASGNGNAGDAGFSGRITIWEYR